MIKAIDLFEKYKYREGEVNQTALLSFDRWTGVIKNSSSSGRKNSSSSGSNPFK